MRHGTVLMALGRVFSGSLDSPAVTPTSSTARKANITICRVISVPFDRLAIVAVPRRLSAMGAALSVRRRIDAGSLTVINE